MKQKSYYWKLYCNEKYFNRNDKISVGTTHNIKFILDSERIFKKGTEIYIERFDEYVVEGNSVASTIVGCNHSTKVLRLWIYWIGELNAQPRRKFVIIPTNIPFIYYTIYLD